MRCLGRVDHRIVVHAGGLQHFFGKFLPYIAAIQNGLGTFRGIVRRPEPFRHGSPMLTVALTPVSDHGAHLIAQMHALAAGLGQKKFYIFAAVRLHRHTAILTEHHRTGEPVIGGGHRHHFALGAAFHTGMVKQFDVHLVLRHRAVQAPSRNENIAFPIVTSGKAKAGRQLDNGTGNGAGHRLILIRGKTGRIGAVLHHQFTGGHHGGDAHPQAGVVRLKVVLQFPQRHRAALDCVQDIFLQRGHFISPLQRRASLRRRPSTGTAPHTFP